MGCSMDRLNDVIAAKGYPAGSWVECTTTSSKVACFFKCSKESKKTQFKAMCKNKQTGTNVIGLWEYGKWDVEMNKDEKPVCPLWYADNLPSNFNVNGGTWNCKNKRKNVLCELACDYEGFKRPSKPTRSYVTCDATSGTWSASGTSLTTGMCDAVCTSGTNRMISNADGDDLEIPNASYQCSKKGRYEFKCGLYCNQSEQPIAENTCKTFGQKAGIWKTPTVDEAAPLGGKFKTEFKKGKWGDKEQNSQSQNFCASLIATP